MLLRCGECGCRLDPWDLVFSWDCGDGAEYVCEGCFDGLFSDLTRMERAALVRSEAVRAGDLGGAEDARA